MKQALFEEYNKFLTYDQQRLESLKKRTRQLAFLRLAAFLAIILALIYLPRISPWLAWSVAGVSFFLFIYWIKRFQKKEKEKILFSNLIEINKKELAALDEEYNQFDDGQEFTDPHHHFTFDLDIFGPGSIFQFVNRTVTQLGKKRLANYLRQPETDIPTIKKRQEALLELAKYSRWRQFFAAKGNTSDEQDFQILKKITEQVEFGNSELVGRLLIILPLVSFLSFGLCQFLNLPWALLVGSLLLNGAVLYANRKRIGESYALFGSQAKRLSSYTELLVLVEEKEFEAPLLNELKSHLLTGQEKASESVRLLQQRMAEFDYRQNLLVGSVLNALLLWDLRCSLRLFHWQRKHARSIEQWFEVLAQFDALSSLANLNHNHPEWTLPKLEDGDFHLTANKLKHPLIKEAKNIGNDFRMNGHGQIAIITGANMAGKSTFLRTIGVNLILAMNGCRAHASWLSLKPIQLFTNMRTTDNLQNDESYFFAELQRLKAILDEIKAGVPVFVIIDEMLKGTNSEDKLSGSIKLIEQLIQLKAVGLVATHDLKLTELATRYPQNITNKCFEIELTDEELLFDYKLTDGVTSTMNANFLMRKMGIIS
ncbi:MutS-related protein [Sunxiuqinia dokdonensis]|uniref:DNA mismatch repair proteins mutS family domain-containing protein n=1 Tax=Sunxiuqinia dokdonensis TaxID=1409788 RepID=A0A0L8VF57_9BACT|nr:hypothetical protein [Sunxiuqinia dokdonensis]KOH47094.1 hypothetical protein NC99_01370 [Sunxiuqinia dokdonensis]